MPRKNIHQRAAEYFGAERDPRRTLTVGRYKVLVVVPRGESVSLAIYSEEGDRPDGHYVLLNRPSRGQLIEALHDA